ncbi:hypothetical protein [Lewinella sp. LCG006]|uniref:hypothetical protein n=1 Tax=Lewinella sp. LCG006 TaxID=3231911 RepID=UPI003460909A
MSNLKRSAFRELSDFIEVNSNKLLCPYSPTHFQDVMKSYSPDNKLFNEDIDTLRRITKNHVIRWNGSRTEPLIGDPQLYVDYFLENEDILDLFDFENIFRDLDDESDHEIATALKLIYDSVPLNFQITPENEGMLKMIFPNITPMSTMWDLMKDIGPFLRNLTTDRDYYKGFRSTIKQEGVKLESNAGNWRAEEVIDRIDKYLNSISDTDLSFLQMVEASFGERDVPPSRFEVFTTSYMMLDLIGYKPDKLPKKTDNLQNIQADAEHAFYAAHCDFFVAGDKKLMRKAEVLYEKFGITTKVVNPSEFISFINRIIHDFSGKADDPLLEAFSFVKKEEIVSARKGTEHDPVDVYGIRLPIFYFNFFDSIVYEQYQDGLHIISFKRNRNNYSDFVFYTEVDKLFDSLAVVLGFEKDNIDDVKHSFVRTEEGVSIVWNYDLYQVKLIKDPKTTYPILFFIYQNNE